jgi:KaiC/GvpD/RAD55 family RecA-like ATPase
MPFHIIENAKPKLPRVNFECDKVIDPKLEEIPAIKQCFSKSFTTLVSGGCGSGKTTFVIQTIKGVFKNCFEEIILIIPENSFDSFSEKDKLYFRKYLPEENIIHEFDIEVLNEVYGKLEENSSNRNNTLIIIDDFADRLKDKQTEKILSKIFLKNRHLRTSVMILTQNYFMVPKKIREISNNLVMFNTNKSQNEKMFEEQFDLKHKQFNELMELLPTTHDYLLLNLKYKKIYHNWNEIVFDNEKK